MSRVAVVKGCRGHEPVFRALGLIEYKVALAGFDRVLIKVNFITTKTWDTGATTDPIVVEAIILKLKSLPVEVQVVESDATVTNATKAFKVFARGNSFQTTAVGFPSEETAARFSASLVASALRASATPCPLGLRSAV